MPLFTWLPESLPEKSESALAWGPQGVERHQEASLSLVLPTQSASLAASSDFSDSLEKSYSRKPAQPRS
jgi:hypothetical protein